MLNRILAALFVVVCGHAQDRWASIKGAVSNAITHEPIRKASLRLRANEIYPAVTDDQGKFSIEKIEPGSYSLEASRPGFLTGEYENGVEIHLSAGQDLTAMNVELMPQAVITGRVTDPDGDIWTDAHLEARRAVWRKGKRELVGNATWDVNDRGEFRISGLAPGTYYLSAIVDDVSRYQRAATVTLPQLQTTWYPNSAGPERSTPVTVSAGSEITGIEIRLRTGGEKNRAIRGSLIGFEDLPKLPEVVPPWAGLRVLLQGEESSESQRVSVDNAGKFQIKSVPPGHYRAIAMEGYGLQIELGRATFDIEDRDIDNLAIEIHPPRTLKGVLKLEGGGAIKPGTISVQLSAVDHLGDTAVEVHEDGSFTFENIGLQTMRVIVNSRASLSGYLKNIRYAGVDSSDTTFTFAGDERLLELTYSTRGATISGHLNAPDRHTAPKIVFVADSQELREVEMPVLMEKNLAFSIRNIPPGDYILFALEDPPEGSWTVPEFLREIQSKGLKIHLGEAQTESVEVPLMSKSELAPILTKLGIE